ncbi:hypothetical protein FRX31_027016, partial [Thalictrum thalictroides]
ILVVVIRLLHFELAARNRAEQTTPCWRPSGEEEIDADVGEQDNILEQNCEPS